ncbi:MAG TPA: SUF system Fe-S cluster assembly regulator [Rhodospirillaceae bacterium]|nr:SUF system Fe-S cluster assembly regulator [Rhodospirillaceae bacterium]
MIKVSRLADYAVVILAAFKGSGNAVLSAAALAEKTRLPEPTVSKVLKLLVKEGILNSVRGANGGYVMNNDAANISIAKIVKAVDGPISLTACVEGGEGSCDYESCCAVKGRWNPVNAALNSALESITLADMTS